MTVAELLSKIDARELHEWMALEKVVGLRGEYREDVRAGFAAMTNAAAHGIKNVALADFMPCRKQEPQGEEEIAETMQRAISGR
jgi:hypothetical protein